MPTTLFACPGCGRAYQVDERWVGRLTACQFCGKEFVVPNQGEATSAGDCRPPNEPPVVNRPNERPAIPALPMDRPVVRPDEPRGVAPLRINRADIAFGVFYGILLGWAATIGLALLVWLVRSA